MFIINNRLVFFILSAVLVLASIFCLFKFGLNFGTDFTGGAITEVVYSGTLPTQDEVKSKIETLNLGDLSLQQSGENSYIIRSRDLSDSEHTSLLAALKSFGTADNLVTEKRFSSVGPTLGKELARKGIISMIIVVILILFYVAFVFRQVSKPVSSWMYGLVVIITMCHDVLIPTGIFALLGVYFGVTIDALFLTAFLTILGLSVNDKIVALDRIRENLRHNRPEKFDEVVGRSLSETMTRSINTSVTIILVLLSIFFFGGETTKYFALAMAIGMIVATYSSIFIAAPLLVVWNNRRG